MRCWRNAGNRVIFIRGRSDGLLPLKFLAESMGRVEAPGASEGYKDMCFFVKIIENKFIFSK